MIAEEILLHIGELKGLKNEEQMVVDYLLDKLLYIIFTLWDDVVLGGGTCINRFYGGRRFSRDLDIYSEGYIDVSLVVDELEREGFSVELSKGITRVGFRPYYFTIEMWREPVIVKLDIISSTPREFIKTKYESYYPDIPPIDINILTVVDLLREKIRALLSEARWKIADVYDIYFICRKYRLDWRKFCDPDKVDEIKKRAEYLIKRDWKVLEDTLLEEISQDEILRYFK